MRRVQVLSQQVTSASGFARSPEENARETANAERLHVELSPSAYAANYNTLLGERRTPDENLAAIPELPADRPVGEYVADLRTHGCTVIRGLFAPADVAAFKAEHDTALEMWEPHIQAMSSAKSEAGLFYKGEAVLEGCRLRKNAEGRFELTSVDSRDGGALATEKTRLAATAEPLILPPLLRAVLEAAMPMSWRLHQCGTLPTLAGAEAGPWHRDVNLMLGREELDLELPDFYMNVLTPLDRVDRANGTEMLLGSHRVLQRDLGGCARAVVEAGPGDCVVFNGKIVHRGQGNGGGGNGADESGGRSRSLVFSVFTAQWYEQGRDRTGPKARAYDSAKEYDD